MREDELETLKVTLSRELEEQRGILFGAVRSDFVEYAEGYFWDYRQQNFREDDLVRYGFQKGMKVLDVAAGCGQFIEYGARKGLDVWGIEPEQWKLAWTKRKLTLSGLAEHCERIVEGVGEALPFDDCAFDFVTSYQTLEHVQDPEKVLEEMVRVVKPGGGVFIRCPDYRSTFEAHYQLPWLPLFPRGMAKLYLKALKRPTAGLDTIQYVTKRRILRALTSLEKGGGRLFVIDDSRCHFENQLRRRGWPLVPGAYELWAILNWVKVLFRRELSVSLFVRVQSK